jgi:hypothetical protein
MQAHAALNQRWNTFELNFNGAFENPPFVYQQSKSLFYFDA